MAVGSSSSVLPPIHLQDMDMDMDRTQSYPRSGSHSSAATAAHLREIIEEEEEEEEPGDSPPESDAKVLYVALGKEVKDGMPTLLWALRNTERTFKSIVVLHVHRPPQMIPMMGGKFPASQLKESQVRAYRQIEREKMDKSLDEYMVLCTHAKVPAEKLVIEMDDVVKGILELIALHGINNLIMGTAADRRTKALKSKTAISLQQQADPSCKIWFVCKGNLICTREAGLNDYGIPQTRAISISSTSSQSEQLRSRSLPQGQVETLNWLRSPMQEIFRRRSRSISYEPCAGGNVTTLPVEEIGTTSTKSGSSTEGSVADPWEGIPRNPLASSCSTSPLNQLSSNTSSSQMLKDEESEQGSVMLRSVNESEDHYLSSAGHELEDVGVENEVYEKLKEAITEAENLRHEAYEESCRRHKAEWDAIEASRKAKASETLYSKELKQRKEVEETLAREQMELEQLKVQRDEVFEELQKALEQESNLEQQIADSNSLLKDLEGKLSAAQHLLSTLRQEHNGLQRETDTAVREADELRQRIEEASTSTQRVMNFSEFSYSELEQATHNFDNSMKIGEGGYGSVYKGFLRHTMVAIKMLNPQNVQGQAEFYQEVDVLSRVRHPHLVTLIGVCSESWALIYEYCPNGSLEDRLVCKDNTAPLTWQARTRIAAEICSALIFLHSNKPLTVVHGDLKPANILIDANFVSKLGDFGICRLLVQSNNTTTLYSHTDHPKGTFVYMDPEFIASGDLTPSSDVYSFGIILLRIMTGRPVFGLTKEVGAALNENNLQAILDPTAGDWPFVQAKQLAHLALRCCEMKRKSRPDLALEAWKVLEPSMKSTSSARSSSLPFWSLSEDTSCIPSYFICPVFQEIMRDPHIAADGFTYEAEALKGWLDSGNDTSPMTNVKLLHQDLIPNHALRSAIQEWLQQHK